MVSSPEILSSSSVLLSLNSRNSCDPTDGWGKFHPKMSWIIWAFPDSQVSICWRMPHPPSSQLSVIASCGDCTLRRIQDGIWTAAAPRWIGGRGSPQIASSLPGKQEHQEVPDLILLIVFPFIFDTIEDWYQNTDLCIFRFSSVQSFQSSLTRGR